MRILLIEDDTVLGAAVRDQIAADGHSVDWVTRLDAAQDALLAAAFDLILLDLMLPDGRGVTFLRALRGRGDVTPVIILTALDQVSDRIEGLNAGADDYLVKPFDLSELSARIAAVARRSQGDRLAGRRAFHDQRVAGSRVAAAVDLVVAVADPPGDRVVAAAPFDGVRACAANNHIGIVVAIEHVVVGRAGKILNSGKFVAFRGATGLWPC